MASKLGLRLALAPSACGLGLRAPVACKRTLSSLSKIRSAPVLAHQQRITLPRATLQHSFRRSYADTPPAPQVNLSPPPKPKKRFRILRFLWRLTYLSILGGIGYVGYQIWWIRNPTEQFEPDPNKKTLVVLGTGPLHSSTPSR